MNLRGATTLVTGATGGIGQAIAAKLAAHGSELVLTGRRADILEPMAEKLNGRAFPADLADERAIEALLVAAGPIDVVVANAALPATGLLADYSGHQIDRALAVNLRAPILMAKLAGEGMVARRRGHLVFINSLSGKTASGYASLYNATKFGMRGFALALREDLRTHNVGVSTIFPGYVRNAGMFADSGAKLPVGIGTRSPEDVAGATVRAIERDLAEVDVAPWPMRMIGWAGGAAPWLAAAIQRRAGADAITAQLAEGQRYKR
ncbi:SDR family NAD(P)-dependent oxidoreductase [Mycolicibacterium boenickei]|uniref:SDR family NAD(P)-dependent oxidoreductase n=1 Tax=Mycolicibacterium boenickei TaxID=146017 RepID=A0AAX3A1B9_9MYCO|nr:SDR family NAD(P)-dependent oxidoreductase [Mycolicibacterium boenickei]PEG59871.1 oxidoreductase [Mycolicibacterium boenickei]UNC01355.1 SDR family NAD(P)-dependent oxidoreductase [Mycolicibacterium boenickei]BBX91228.1 putative short chain dehydrogenase/reductase [Mycolicibacterium boenickei]